jgi:hypothetical protein
MTDFQRFWFEPNKVFVNKKCHCTNTFLVVLCFLAVFPVLPAHAQHDFEPLKNQVKISPVRLIDFINPGLELGYERLHHRRFSAQLSLSYMTDFFGKTAYDGYSGHRISLEEKYIFTSSEPVWPYFSAEFVFLNAQIRNTERFAPQEFWDGYLEEDVSYFDSFGIDKQTLTFNLKAGIQVHARGFVIDVCAGLGFKHKDVKHFDKTATDDVMDTPRHPTPFHLAIYEGKYNTINIPVNIKIGYAF